MSKNTLQVSTPSDVEIRVIREFNASRQLVWNAMTKPQFLREWMFGPPGWSMTVCDVSDSVYRYVWTGPNGEQLGMGGRTLERVPPERIVNTEKFDDYPGEAVGTMVLTEAAGKTTVTLTLKYES